MNAEDNIPEDSVQIGVHRDGLTNHIWSVK
jgi:hypothetical protein